MKISLVFPPFYFDAMYNLPPLGLINIGTVLQSAGHQVTLHDFVLEIRLGLIHRNRNIYERCADSILSTAPDLVAFSAQCTTYPGVIQLSKNIKERDPSIQVIVGGHNASFVDETTLSKFSWIDAVVRGEGEETMAILAAAYEAGLDESGVLGVTGRKGGRPFRNPDRPLMADLNLLPLPDYGLVAPLSTYRDACGLPRSIAILEVGRGCPHACVYCSESVLWRRRCRTFSVARLVGEMRRLHEAHGAQCFLLAYDQFTADRRFVTSFCERLIAEGLQHLPWYCISRLDTVDAQMLRLMRSAGCESMCYGIDSGSARTLAFIGKSIDETILYQRVQETTNEGMVPTLSFVVGFPEEEKADIDATLMLALKTGIQGNSNPLIQLPTVLPGTPLHERYQPVLVREVDTYFSLGIEFDEGRRLIADERLINEDSGIFSSFYNLPNRAFSLQSLHGIAAGFPLLVNLYPKSFLLLCLSLNRSVSDLFFEWMAWIREKEGREGLILTPADCYHHFTDFGSHAFKTGCPTGWDHVLEIIRYETCAIAVAKEPTTGAATPGGSGVSSTATATVDISGALRGIPTRKKNTVVAAFSRNLPAVITDLKAGVFRDTYPIEPGWLVFYQENKELTVLDINDFGKEFLSLCSGEASLNRIAETLRPQYGAGFSEEAFLQVCRQTAETLAELRLLA